MDHSHPPNWSLCTRPLSVLPLHSPSESSIEASFPASWKNNHVIDIQTQPTQSNFFFISRFAIFIFMHSVMWSPRILSWVLSTRHYRTRNRELSYSLNNRNIYVVRATPCNVDQSSSLVNWIYFNHSIVISLGGTSWHSFTESSSIQMNVVKSYRLTWPVATG